MDEGRRCGERAMIPGTFLGGAVGCWLWGVVARAGCCARVERVERGSAYGVAVRCEGVVCRTVTYRQVLHLYRSRGAVQRHGAVWGCKYGEGR